MALGAYAAATSTFATAIGTYNKATGYGSHAQGWSSESSGSYAISESYQSLASGNFSHSKGYYTIASGDYSNASGTQTVATGYGSYAQGWSSESSGSYAISEGYQSLASGNFSHSKGYYTIASGVYSNASGSQTVATGNTATVTGYLDTASGTYSTAMGFRNNASGNYSVSIGSYTSTNGYQGAFTFGDISTSSTLRSSANNQFSSRFAGGYRLYTNSASTTGLTISAGGTSWSSVSDQRVKENVQPISYGLKTVQLLRPYGYNYLGNSFTNFGFIAQDVLKVIPEVVDVPENPDDLLSIRYTEMIPVLTKAIQELADENELLRSQMDSLQNDIEMLKSLVSSSN